MLVLIWAQLSPRLGRFRIACLEPQGSFPVFWSLSPMTLRSDTLEGRETLAAVTSAVKKEN